MLSLSHSLCISLISQTHMYTHRCLRERERKPTELEKRLSQDERLHTHCLHAELFRHLPATAHTVAEACATQTHSS